MKLPWRFPFTVVLIPIFCFRYFYSLIITIQWTRFGRFSLLKKLKYNFYHLLYVGYQSQIWQIRLVLEQILLPLTLISLLRTFFIAHASCSEHKSFIYQMNFKLFNNIPGNFDFLFNNRIVFLSIRSCPRFLFRFPFFWLSMPPHPSSLTLDSTNLGKDSSTT